MQKPKEITALNSRLRKIHSRTNNNALPVLGADELETDVESETGLLDINDVPPHSFDGHTHTLPVGTAEGETVELSDSETEAVVVSSNRWLPTSPTVTCPVQASSTEEPDGIMNRFKPDPEQHRAWDA